jgi:serine/threonine protein kinase
MYAAQVVTVFDYLHQRGIVYRDLKPENILLNGDGYLKLTDFGFAKKIEGKTYTMCGTPSYTAPEVLLGQGYGKAVDWWSLGVLLYEMLVGIDPFADDDIMNTYRKILTCQVVYPDCMDSKVKSLLRFLLVDDVSMRLGSMINGVNDIYTHKFFSDFDWEGLKKMQLVPVYIPKIK